MFLLETERLGLRYFRKSDLEALHQILSDPTTMQFWPKPYSHEQTQAWLQRHIQRLENDGFARFAVFLKGTNTLIGDCGVNKSKVNGKWENDLGYIIHHPYWKQGFALEASKACLDFAFQELKLKSVVANMADEHIASQKTALKLGFTKELEFINVQNLNKVTHLYRINKL